MNLKKTIFLFLFISLHAQATEELKWSKVTLVSPYKTISKKSKKIPIGLSINLRDGWHSYWQNPGESGKALKAKWFLPEESSLKHLNWPLPIRIKFESFTNFIYKKSFLIQGELSLPKNNSEALHLKASVEWLICKKICIPMSQEVELTLKLAEEAEIDFGWKEVFDKNQARLPQTIEGKISLQKKRNKNQALIVTSQKTQILDLFPLEKNTFSLKPPSVLFTDGLRHSLLLSSVKTRSKLENTKALLVVKNKTGRAGFIYTFTEKKDSVLWFVLLAFLGGLILNFMPCVLPIVFLKFSNTLEQAKKEKQTIILGNIFYSVGVISTFVLLAFILRLLKEGGESLGWGFQMQSPYFLLSIIFLFTLMSVNFMGWLSTPLPSFTSFHRGTSYFKHFLTGVLSTAAASPCTVPFMGAAVGYAFLGNTAQMMTIFIFLGLGLSFPYLLLSVFPHWIKLVPTPGNWSTQLKHFMAFPMLATSIWLIYLLNQLESQILLPLLLSLLVFTMGFWLINNSRKRSLFKLGISLVLICSSVIYPYFILYQPPQQAGIEWESFSTQKMTDLLLKKEAIFINFTADWCLTCKLNEGITFKNKKVIQFLQKKNIRTLKGDWTYKNPEISELLTEYNRSGVPFYLYFPVNSSAPGTVLPELLTPKIFLKFLDK